MRRLPLDVPVDRQDRFYRWLAPRLPRRLVWWCGLVIFSHHATHTMAPVDQLTVVAALRRWAEGR